MMKFIIASLLLSLLCPSYASYSSWKTPAYSPASLTLGDRSFMLGNYSDYFTTDSYYEHDGTETGMEAGESFERIQSELRVGYGVNEKLQLNVGAMYRQNNSVALDSQKNSYSNSKAGMESYYLGLKYGFAREGRYHYSIEGKYRIPGYTNELYDSTTANEKIVLGDVESNILVGGNLSYTFPRGHHLVTSIFYNKSNTLSDQIDYDVQGVLSYSKFALIAGLQGVYSLLNDGYSENKSDKPVLDQSASKLYNSINRSYMAPYLQVNIALGERWSFQLGGRSIISGVSTDKGMEYFGALVLTTSGRSASQKILNQFTEYNVEATVIKVSPRQKFVVINKGLAAELEKGMRVDIYGLKDNDPDETVLLATGFIYQVKVDSAIVRLTSVFRSRRIRNGDSAKSSH